MQKKRNIPLCVADIDDREIQLVTEVLRSGWLAHGPKVKEFEEKFAQAIGVKHATAVNSCTSALELALLCLDSKGEVLVPSFTFVASANTIVTTGHKPVFVDIDSDTCNMDLADAKRKITKNTVAMMPVHYAGLPCNMDEIQSLAGQYNLAVIEDSAETLGGKFRGKKTGSFGAGCFSFYPTKNMTTGEGGMLTTNDDVLAKKVSTLKAHGISTSAYDREKSLRPWERAAVVAGYNYRLCDILAAVGIVQLEKLDDMNRRRRSHAAYLNQKLDQSYLKTPVEPEHCEHVYQMYTIQLDARIDRAKFVLALREKGVGASVHFDPPVHKHPFYLEHFAQSTPLSNTEKVANRIVTLPMYPGLSREDLDYMVDCVGECILGAQKTVP